MAQTSIGPDFHESFNIHGNRFPQISFNHPISLDYVPDANRFILGKVFYLGCKINSGFLANLCRPALPYSVDIGQTDWNPFVQWQINSRDSSQ